MSILLFSLYRRRFESVFSELAAKNPISHQPHPPSKPRIPSNLPSSSSTTTTMATTTLTLSSKNTPFPWALAALASSNADKATLTFDDEASTSLSHDGKTITDKDEIVSVLSSAVDLAPPSYTLKGLYETAKKLPGLTAMPEITAALDVLDDHLAYRTFVQGEQVSAGDYILWGALKCTFFTSSTYVANPHTPQPPQNPSASSRTPPTTPTYPAT